MYTPASSDRSITILIPGLLGPVGGSAECSPTVPVLETLIGRSDYREARPAVEFEQQVFSLFGLSAPVDSDLPVAAVTRALDLGVIDTGWWLRADPVHLRPERDRLILLDTQVVPLNRDEASRLTGEVMEAYDGDGWLLKSPRPGRWYLKPPRAPRIVTTPLPRVVGKDIHPYLPQGKDGKAWHTILNEIQILLHTAAVNSEREQRGELPINSLWFWGGGRLPRISQVEWAHVFAEEPVSLALARLSEVPSSARPTNFTDWLRQAQRPGAHLVVLDQARATVQYRQEREWMTFVERLEREWMTPLWYSLKARELDELVIYTDVGTYRIGQRQIRRWWRRRRPLASFR